MSWTIPLQSLVWTKGGSLISKCKWATNWMLKIVLVKSNWGDLWDISGMYNWIKSGHQVE
jgi:hypothetical protein